MYVTVMSQQLMAAFQLIAFPKLMSRLMMESVPNLSICLLRSLVKILCMLHENSTVMVCVYYMRIMCY